MKQIFEKSDFKNLIEAQGVATVTKMKFSEEGISYEMHITKEGLKQLFTKVGMFVRDVEVSNDEIIVSTDTPSNLIKPRV